MFRLLEIWIAGITMLIVLGMSVFSQETDRSPFAIEFPEINSGKISTIKSYVTRSDIDYVKFWMSNPAAETVEYSRIFVKINGKAANTICSQRPSSNEKVFQCDLRRLVGFRLMPKENRFEIEAAAPDGRRYFASFIVVTDAVAAQKQSASNVQTRTLGFSGRKYAVVLGVSKYQYNDVGLGNLNYADADANAMYRWLVDKGGFMPGDILLMTNEQATLSGVRDSLERFLTKAAETDLVLFFFAGHGTPDPFNPKELYYLMTDSKVADLEQTGFRMTDLRRILDERLRSKRVIFLLDTCHSAGVSGKKVLGLRSEEDRQGGRGLDDTEIDVRQLERVEIKNDISRVSGRILGLPGRAVFTSSGVNEASRENKKWGGGHGVFTWAVLEGLGGQADINLDKVITANELFSYVTERVRTETKSKQNPQLFSNLGGGLEIVILK